MLVRDIKYIELTQDQVAIVDASDYEWLQQYSWCASFDGNGKNAVAIRGIRGLDGKRSTVRMSREILGLCLGDGLEADHFNHNTLDNRRSNLRILTPKANKEHQPSREGSSSFYVGVTWDVQRELWRAQIQLNGKVINLGRFETEVEAAQARDRFVLANKTGHEINFRSRR